MDFPELLPRLKKVHKYAALDLYSFSVSTFFINATLSKWLEWSVWIKFDISKKPRMWEYVN